MLAAVRSPSLRRSVWLAAAGFALVAVAAFLPWKSTGIPGLPRAVVNGIGGDEAPGLQVLLVAGVALVVITRRFLADSPSRSLELLPAFAGIATFLVAADLYVGLAPDVAAPGHALDQVIEPGTWLALAGSLFMALGGVATSVQAIRRQRLPLGRDVVANLRDAASPLGAIGGLAIGAIGFAWVSTTPLAKEPVMSLLAPLCLVGVPVAITLAWDASFGRRIARRTPPLDDPSGVRRERLRH